MSIETVRVRFQCKKCGKEYMTRDHRADQCADWPRCKGEVWSPDLEAPDEEAPGIGDS